MTRKNTSTGPRTIAGKRRSRRNARTHGLFSSELILSTKDRPEFDRFRRDLQTELSPNTATLGLLFDDLVSSGWIKKMALRLLEQAVRKFSFTTTDIRTCAKSLASHGGWTSRDRLKLVEELQNRVARGEVISKSANLEKAVIDAFGEDLWRNLTEWATESPARLALASAIVAKCENFHMPLPVALQEPKTVLPASVYPQLMCKLLEVTKRNLLSEVGDGVAPEHEVQRTDLFLRYHVKARRDFYQALERYRSFKAESERRRPPDK